MGKRRGAAAIRRLEPFGTPTVYVGLEKDWPSPETQRMIFLRSGRNPRIRRGWRPSGGGTQTVLKSRYFCGGSILAVALAFGLTDNAAAQAAKSATTAAGPAAGPEVSGAV